MDLLTLQTTAYSEFKANRQRQHRDISEEDESILRLASAWTSLTDFMLSHSLVDAKRTLVENYKASILKELSSILGYIALVARVRGLYVDLLYPAKTTEMFAFYETKNTATLLATGIYGIGVIGMRTEVGDTYQSGAELKNLLVLLMIITSRFGFEFFELVDSRDEKIKPISDTETNNEETQAEY